MEERFFITGATGCIGAWVVRNLVKEGMPVCASVRDSSLHRLELILSREELAGIDFRKGDITDLSFLERTIGDFGANRIIHLAAMQLPFCKADPPKGAMANVLGTVNIFEAAKRAGLNSLVYSSTTAVYGTADEYPPGPLANDAPLLPRSHYGVYKQANEWGARVYWNDDGIASIGLRPYVVYGPGRDQGMTSTPTKAMLAAALGRPYRITYGGRFAFQYADDAARAFVQAARVPFSGAAVFNIGGRSVSMPEVIDAISAACPESAGAITFDETPLPFPEEVDNVDMTKLLGGYREVPLGEGVRETIRCFRDAVAAGKLGTENFT
ncbi:MAG: NAD-dependent epimerase/dehydratase family protein [Spirochaetes bacterium]|nr:NAD-dependent epimerase/dehydratase family protein [Spirochaetota bacterium]